MKLSFPQRIRALLVAVGLTGVGFFVGGCAVGYDSGIYGGAVYDSGWGGPYGYGYSGDYFYGTGYYNRGYYNRGYYANRGYYRGGGGYNTGHRGNWGPGSWSRK